MGNKTKTHLLTGTSVVFAATATATAYGVSWLKKNTKTNYLPKGSEKPFKNSYFYERSDYRIHYRIDESKQNITKGKIFMVHGFGCNTIFFDEMVELLTKEGYMCVRVDTPNFGYSTRETENVRPIPREDLLFDVMDIVSPNEKWILAGHSMGGGIAINMILQRPQYFKALTLYGPELAFSAPKFVQQLAITKPFTKILDVVIKYGGGFNPLIKLVLTAATLDKDYMDKFDINLATDPLRMDRQGTAVCYMTKNATQIQYPEYKKINVPIYLVWGEKDVLMTKKAAEKLEEALPNPEVFFMYGGGHCMIQSRAEEVIDGTLKFFAKNNF